MIKRSDTTTTRDGLGLLALLAVVLAFLAVLAALPRALQGQAQELDSRWLAWSGCWELVGAPGEEVVCVRPGAQEASVRLVSSREGAEDRVIVADGTPRPVSQAGCEGTETARFSNDGRRIYVEAEYTCDGGAVQSGSGVIAMVNEDEWVDIRSLAQDGEQVAWVQRYVTATPAALQAAGEVDLLTPQVQMARRLAARAPNLHTLVDVTGNVDGRAASAWILETGYGFDDLNGETLVALADAGVEPEVIDMAVAVSNPDYFNVGPSGDLYEQEAVRERGYVASAGYDPFDRRRSRYGAWSPWGFLYSPYAYYGYSPYYGGGYGYYGGYYGYRPTVLVVTPRTTRNNGGRAIAGRGYTRGSSSPGTGQGYVPSRGSQGSAGAASAGSGSRGSSGSSTGRKAKPRGGGGGGL